MKVSGKRALEIIEQGRKQFQAIFEDFNCPFDERKKPVERKLWLKGWHEAKIKWFKPFEDRKRAQARRNGEVSWQKNKSTRLTRHHQEVLGFSAGREGIVF